MACIILQAAPSENLRKGPVFFGDSDSTDPQIVAALGARESSGVAKGLAGVHMKYRVDKPIGWVLGELQKYGYTVVGFCSAGQMPTLYWTVSKPLTR